ncbi:hypothetical protein [Streptomyces sp. HB2AG]|uniref:hypothetical protein n=1 Tax=Streptomyces sp. HB2AG TaxID=2983400 RepID=UPI0022AA7B77|nr:hypothetical protein [Streptomyces sp. HB2AG]MCZ2526204.1 hypothetical protein [Streptomyces sp. HB2AG]
MNILLADSLCAEVSGEPLPYIPRYFLSGLSVAVGDYTDAAEKERALVGTFGSSQWLWSDNDEIRFRESDQRLCSFSLTVPEEPVADPSACERWLRAPVLRGSLLADGNQDFAMPPAKFRWVDEKGTHLVCLDHQEVRPEAERSVLFIAPDVYLLIADGRTVGWMLKNPAAYLTNSWDHSGNTPVEEETHLLLKDYLSATEGSTLESLQNGNEAACQDLRQLEERILARTDDRARRSVLGEAVRRLAEDWC